MQLHGLLFQLGITRAPEYMVKGLPRPGRMEFTYTVEVFDGQDVVGKHACPTPSCDLCCGSGQRCLAGTDELEPLLTP
jgi:hypothetical protein